MGSRVQLSLVVMCVAGVLACRTDYTTDANAEAGAGVDPRTDGGGTTSADGSTNAQDGGGGVMNGNFTSGDPCESSTGVIDPSCVDEAHGLFVSSTAPDGGTGTRASPFKTIASAMKAVSAAQFRVFLCGVFVENVTIGSKVSLLGGFTCAALTWKSSSTPTPIASASAGTSIVVSSVSDEIDLTDLAITTSTAVGVAGTPAIGLLLVTANNVQAARISITASSGADGAAGKTTTNWTGACPGGGVAGIPAGGPATSYTCAGTGSSVGGAGANDATTQPQPGTSIPTVIGSQPNQGSSSPAMCKDGTVGAAGTAPGAGGHAIASAGKITTKGWVDDGKGGDGQVGSVGQGGGGGGAATSGFGGGGAPGGCGGGSGGGGGDGGASFAIVLFASKITLSNSSLVSGNGGTGGSGGSGQAGQAGGPGGPGLGGAAGCNGAYGGNGSAGSGGAGGNGGDSAAVALTADSTIAIDATTHLMNGVAGAGGAGGTSTSVHGDPGNPGAAAMTLVR